ncbi:hypoxanthine phosphoribosyltransferase [Deferribacter desulfuricans SSM1]|uniref:Hypoxanthine phosphoribosyltransferase n=1 Tax=Deferribacter desulfuricans (strain DSM 14783 / JCM 11476 / NBRC 101012 / SSM1) TaxID=639282 RepID=D3PD25_DEFDS|nr:hypoxanthine phosphoribosyltransferase [Deferribacter desulfuricans]BAI80498.1 hypoxanthine phosphoribosyltransferase [Deferribacter desulfuricans SSM1]
MNNNYILEPFIKKEQIADKVKELGEKITSDYAGEELFLVGVLKGSWIFMADLVRYIDLPLEVSFISVSSYVGQTTKSSGVVRLLCDIDKPLNDRNVILVEDIVDTGLTLSYLKKLLEVRNPKSFKICALLDKPERRISDISADYVGFTIPDEFVVGYGLDYNGYFRNLPDISILKFK